MSRPIDGRVFITWPAATARPTALSAWGCAFEDADTGEAIVDAVAMAMQLGSAEGFDSSTFIEVELTRLVDADGNPIGNGAGSANRLALTPEYEAWNKLQDATGPLAAFVGQKFRTRTFRYIVAEMRVFLSQPGTEPKASVGARTELPQEATQLSPVVVSDSTGAEFTVPVGAVPGYVQGAEPDGA